MKRLIFVILMLVCATMSYANAEKVNEKSSFDSILAKLQPQEGTLNNEYSILRLKYENLLKDYERLEKINEKVINQKESLLNELNISNTFFEAYITILVFLAGLCGYFYLAAFKRGLLEKMKNKSSILKKEYQSLINKIESETFQLKLYNCRSHFWKSIETDTPLNSIDWGISYIELAIQKKKNNTNVEFRNFPEIAKKLYIAIQDGSVQQNFNLLSSEEKNVYLKQFRKKLKVSTNLMNELQNPELFSSLESIEVNGKKIDILNLLYHIIVFLSNFLLNNTATKKVKKPTMDII